MKIKNWKFQNFMVTIVIPTYNEELILKANMVKLFEFCQQHLTDEWQIIIADNASTDRTAAIGKQLAEKYEQIKYFFLPQAGKGRAVLTAWQKFPAQVYVFMDADLATDLKDLPALVQAIKQGYDIAVGSRLIKGAQVHRTIARKIFSRILRLILKFMFKLTIYDAPCGFKAVNQRVVKEIVPQIKNITWFFDTELLVLAQQQNLRIKEIAVSWRDSRTAGRHSKVNIIKVIKDYLKNIFDLYGRIKK